jgi:hypothetical protein
VEQTEHLHSADMRANTLHGLSCARVTHFEKWLVGAQQRSKTAKIYSRNH